MKKNQKATVVVMVLILMAALMMAACGESDDSESDSSAKEETKVPKEPAYTYDLKATETDAAGVEFGFYDVHISNSPDWSEDDWFRHGTYVKKIVDEIKSEAQTPGVSITGYVEGQQFQVFAYDNVVNANAIIMYDWASNSQTGNPVEYKI